MAGLLFGTHAAKPIDTKGDWRIGIAASSKPVCPLSKKAKMWIISDRLPILVRIFGGSDPQKIAAWPTPTYY
jgi:hypothetical protein